MKNVLNIQCKIFKKKCECPHLFYYDLDKNENICVDEYDEYECKQLGYIYLDINLGECKKYYRENKVIFNYQCLEVCPDNAFIMNKNSHVCVY